MGALYGLPPHADDEELRENVRVLARRVAELEAKVVEGGATPPSQGPSDDKLATVATSIYRARQRRARYFDRELFGEPAFEMMLDLFINKVRGTRVSTTSLCLAAHIPQATGLRWIKLLEERGILLRYRAPDDRRLTLTEITSQSFQMMRRYLGEVAGDTEAPMPL